MFNSLWKYDHDEEAVDDNPISMNLEKSRHSSSTNRKRRTTRVSRIKNNKCLMSLKDASDTDTLPSPPPPSPPQIKKTSTDGKVLQNDAEYFNQNDQEIDKELISWLDTMVNGDENSNSDKINDENMIKGGKDLEWEDWINGFLSENEGYMSAGLMDFEMETADFWNSTVVKNDKSLTLNQNGNLNDLPNHQQQPIMEESLENWFFSDIST